MTILIPIEWIWCTGAMWVWMWVVMGIFLVLDIIMDNKMGPILLPLAKRLVAWRVHPLSSVPIPWTRYVQAYKTVAWIQVSSQLPGILLYFILHQQLVHYGWGWWPEDHYRSDQWFSTSLLIIGKTMVAYLVNDVYFYSCHRLLHTYPSLYRHIHRKHHEWKVTYAHIALYSTWLESVCCIVPSAFIGPLVSQMTIWHSAIYIWVSLTTAFLSHSGYRFAGSTRHETHHTNIRYNYGLQLMDLICHTYAVETKHTRIKSHNKAVD